MGVTSTGNVIAQECNRLCGLVLLIRLPFNTCLYNHSNVVFGGEHIIINRYDVNMMLLVNLYNPYGANKPNYILCG